MLLLRVASLLMLVGIAVGATPLITRMKGRKPALDATHSILRVIESLEDENFLDIGSPIKGTAIVSSELARFLDPTLLTLESILFENYCKTPGISAFGRKCRGLDQPTVYSACGSHGSYYSTSGTVNFEAAPPNQICTFFVESKYSTIEVTCKSLNTKGDLSNIKVYSAANLAVNKQLNAGAFSVQFQNGLFIEFKNDATGTQKLSCSWTSSGPVTAA